MITNQVLVYHCFIALSDQKALQKYDSTFPRMNIGQVSSGKTNKPGSKAIVTTLILVGSFILCFLPFLVITGVNQATNSKFRVALVI